MQHELREHLIMLNAIDILNDVRLVAENDYNGRRLLNRSRRALARFEDTYANMLMRELKDAIEYRAPKQIQYANKLQKYAWK